MNAQIKEHIERCPRDIIELFHTLRQLIFDAAPTEPEETLWAKLPSYYVGESFVRLIPFKDHINIEAKAAIRFKDTLTGYQFTPKGMLKIYAKQETPHAVLKQIFAQTLQEESK